MHNVNRKPRIGFLTVLALAVMAAAGCGSGTLHSTSPAPGAPSSNPPSTGGNPPSSATKTLTSIAISPPSVAATVGNVQQFTATAKYSDGSSADVTSSATWNSSAPAVVAINSAGLARAVAAGTASISAALSGTSSNNATFSVTAPASGGSPSPTPTPAPAQYLVYASDQAVSQISGWILQPPSSLKAASGSPFASGSGPSDLVFSPDGHYLYGVMTQELPGVRGSTCESYPDQVGVWSVDHSAGTLTLLQQLTLNGSCGTMAMDSTGKFLYVSETVLESGNPTGMLEVVAVDSSTHSLTLASGSPYRPPESTGALVSDGSYLYVVDQVSGTSPGLLVYKIDAATGALQYQSTASAPGQTADRLAVSPDGSTLYRLVAGTGALNTYAFNGSTGSLTTESTTSTGASAFRIAASPGGHYAAAATEEGVYLFTTGSGGVLKAVAGSPFGGPAVSANFDAADQQLATVSIDNSGNYNVTVYSISAGKVAEEATQPASSDPSSYTGDAVILAK